MFFLIAEDSDTVEFKPLKLTRYRQNSTCELQKVESEVGYGRTFPNRDDWFDPETEELRIWLKLSGGSSPYGTRGIYRLEAEAFVLQEFTALFECEHPIEEGDYAYKQIYP